LLNGDGIGVYGDSMSMQYSFWLPLAPQFNYNVFYNGTQFNWVDLLSQNGYNFGPTNTVLGENYKAYDAAVAGNSSADLTTQVNVLSPDVTAGNIKLVVEMIGANDVNSPEYTTVYNAAANPSYNPLTDPAVQSFMSGVIANIAASIDSTLAENPATKMILGTIPDVGVTPEYHTNFPIASQRAAMTVVTEALNQQILALATEHHFPVIDLFAMAERSLTPLTVGGVKMVEAGGDSGKDEFLSDGFHPGTVVQGLMGNAILMADHLAYHDPVTYMSDQSILTAAAVSHNSSTTFFDVSPYVIAPEPSTLLLAAFGGVVLVWAFRRRSMHRAAE
jgi:hypothetical protein